MSPRNFAEKGNRVRWGWLSVLVAAFTVGLSGALMPGPLTVAVLDHAARTGWSAGLLAALSHVALELLMVGLLAVGLSRILGNRRVAAAVALGGGLILLWMAWGMISTAPAARMPGTGALPDVAPLAGSALAAGALATLANPYWFLWWGTVGAGQLAWARRASPVGVWAFWAGHAGADLLWLGLLSLGMATGLRFMGDGGYRILLYLMGSTLGVLGLYFILSAGRLFTRGGLPAGSPNGQGIRRDEEVDR